ncbi:hypothetical protein DBV15_12503 [Temnothorax longispinosus]|uniref:Uncharacterized protein n=1 Tax=Temnothorax longispinosus TaxID=300112 RepID=A0A4S2JT96_9HYME|nr:hypothetical protein DBV15_12503 [Temnothorax longispinosus]
MNLPEISAAVIYVSPNLANIALKQILLSPGFNKSGLFPSTTIDARTRTATTTYSFAPSSKLTPSLFLPESGELGRRIESSIRFLLWGCQRVRNFPRQYACTRERRSNAIGREKVDRREIWVVEGEITRIVERRGECDALQNRGEEAIEEKGLSTHWRKDTLVRNAKERNVRKRGGKRESDRHRSDEDNRGVRTKSNTGWKIWERLGGKASDERSDARRTKSSKKLRENSRLNEKERERKRERERERICWIKESVRFLAKGERVRGSWHRTATPTATVGPQSSAHSRMVRTVVLGGEKLSRSRHCEHRVVQGTSYIARFS